MPAKYLQLPKKFKIYHSTDINLSQVYRSVAIKNCKLTTISAHKA